MPYPVIALVGYTNAGKSTLFNRLTGAAVDARDQLFATLDPTMRRLALPSGQAAILSDTVGFIADLPTDLVAAFRATLEEVRTADLVIHVRDIAHPEAAAQRSDVLQVLASLGLEHLADEGRLIEFWNKLDLLSGEAPSDRRRRGPAAGRGAGLGAHRPGHRRPARRARPAARGRGARGRARARRRRWRRGSPGCTATATCSSAPRRWPDPPARGAAAGRARPPGAAGFPPDATA